MNQIKEKNIKHFNSDEIDTNKSLILHNCIIETLDFVAAEFKNEVIITNCLIKEFKTNCCWFKEGLLFSNNIVDLDIDYQMGGHNEKEIKIIGNIFRGFFSFFDCHFEEKIIVENNVFMSNSDLLAKENPGFDNLFEKGYSVNNNIGLLDILNL